MKLRRRTAVGAAVVAALIVATGVALTTLVMTPVAVVPSPSMTATPTATPTPSPTTLPSATPSQRPTPTEAASPWLSSRFSMLLLGTDMNSARRAAGDRPRTDAIIVVSVDENQDHVALMSVPRDTVDLPIGGDETWASKINELYQARGGDAMRQAMAEYLGLEIDRYAAVDMETFTGIVNALGGVSVDLDTALADPRVGFSLAAGKHTLDGSMALRYVRHRLQGGDYARAARQQEVALSLAREAAATFATEDPMALEDLVADLDTDVALDELPVLLELARRSRDAEVTSIVFQPPEFATFAGLAGTRGWIIIPNVDAIREAVGDIQAE